MIGQPERSVNFLVNCFFTPLRSSTLRRIVEAARIAFGLCVCHRYLDIAGFSSISDDQGTVLGICILGIVLGVQVAAGVFTQLALVTLAVGLFFWPPIAPTLGDQVAILLCWAFLLAGAGRRWSIDSLLLHGRWKKHIFFRGLFPFALPLCARTFALMRFFQIFMFWGLGVGAMGFHAEDPVSISFQTLHVFYTLSYMSDFYELFRSFSEALPQMFDVFARMSLLQQTIWEALLLPLMLFPLGRWFVIIQGTLFFLFSAVGFNLGYLPFYELIWWGLIIAPGFFIFRIGKKRNYTRLHGMRRLPLSAICFGILGTSVFIGATTLKTIKLTPKVTAFAEAILAPNNLYRVFGQSPINVFNGEDLKLGNQSIMLVELGTDGAVRRLVPFYDGEGGRLELLRNDLLYFDHSLLWRRETDQTRFHEDGRPTDYTLTYIRKLAALDSCLQSARSPVSYRVFFLHRSIDSTGTFPIWTPTSCSYSLDITYTPEPPGLTCKYAFSLPPGHWRGTARAKKTLESLRDGAEQFRCAHQISLDGSVSK